MAKRVRVSDDNGSTWHTLPGNTAELSNEAGDIDDTIFGQDYKSSEAGLIGWQVTANAFYKGFAGYIADIKKSGTSTPMTDEAMSVESGLIYQIDAASKQIWDRDVPLDVEGNNINIAASNIEWVDYLFGRIKFITGYTPVPPITVGGNYLPVANIGRANGFTLTQTAESVENTDYDTAQGNGGFRTFQQGLKTVSLELVGIFALSNAFAEALQDREELIIEINPDGAGRSVARGFFKFASQSQSGDVGALEEERVTLRLNVPDEEGILLPFGWRHTNLTTLSTAVQKLLTAWTGGSAVDVQYLHDGTAGQRGDAYVTEMTLSSGLEEMNTFAVTLQGSGAPTPVP
jgi:predicted secreted protein